MQDEGDTQASKRTGIAAVANAEVAAEELVRQARAEAERILADAKERVRTIREGSHEVGGLSVQALRDAETEEERRRILEAVRTKIEGMRQVALAHEREAADKLVALLFGEP
jgi:vacuolar-type H+-ATPase subunit H